ncbi:glycoside hydrolase [Aureobasidium subglaciale]|nr:glycoside hydrolase [Aureobasidium subglaciale]
MLSTLAILSGLLTFITFTTTVTAHGFVQGIVTPGKKWYPGAQPWWRVNPSIPHAKSAGWSSLNQDLGFVSPSDYGTANIACHKSAKSTNTRIPVNAGDKVKLLWSDWPESHKGPVLTYLAKCPGDCSIVNPTTLDWFKIDQGGLINGNPAPGTWATDTLIANNMSWTITIPSSLLAGSYVLRHEIIALHNADHDNGAQNYPNCINFQISGKGTAKPAGVKYNKLYTAQSKGIAVSIYWPTLTSYTFPGPALWKGAVKRWVERIFEA